MSKMISTLRQVIENEFGKYTANFHFKSNNDKRFEIASLEKPSRVIDGEKQFVVYSCNQCWNREKKLILVSDTDFIISADLDTLEEIADGLQEAIYSYNAKHRSIFF